jgi:hypothetical protein
MGTGAAPALLCGNTTAESWANVNVPTTVVSYCSNYTIAHSLLDLFVGGCNYLIFIQVIRATQPDTSRDGATYRFQANDPMMPRHVNACTRNGVSWNLADCLHNAGYSSFFKFTTDRVIGK